MRAIVYLLIALCATTIVGYAADAPKFSSAEQEVIDVSKARMEAVDKRDTAAWARFVADDCLFVQDDGSLFSKDGMLIYFKKVSTAYDRNERPRDFVVHVHGNTAVLSYRITGHEQIGPTDVITDARRTETLLKQNGAWLLIAIQTQDMPVNFRKPVAVDKNRYQDYVGQYQARPVADVETIYVKDGKLWSQLGDDLAEYLPAGDDTFFVKEGDLSSYTFSRDAQGLVTSYTSHRVDGQEYQNKKIK